MIRFLALGTALLASSAVFAGGGGKLPFSLDPESAQQEAARRGQACMLYFTASW